MIDIENADNCQSLETEIKTIKALADELYEDGVLNFRQHQAYISDAEYASERGNTKDLEDLLADLKDTFGM